MTGSTGYWFCACRDCFDIVVGDLFTPVLCSACEEAGCPGDGECQREDAYSTECEHHNRRAADEFNDECIDCGLPGPYDASRGVDHGPNQ